MRPELLTGLQQLMSQYYGQDLDSASMSSLASLRPDEGSLSNLGYMSAQLPADFNARLSAALEGTPSRGALAALIEEVLSTGETRFLVQSEGSAPRGRGAVQRRAER